MKKLLLAAGLVALVAAGCSSTKPAAQNPKQQPTAEQTPVQQAATPPAQTAQTQSNVKIENVDDALNQINNQAQNEQSLTAGTDDSDLTTSDAAELNSYTEVPNGN